MSFIQTDSVSIAFGERTVLDKINFTIGTGDHLALAGGNGCGKSTLLKIMAGLLKADTGKISIQKNTRISYLPQSGISHLGCTLFEEAEKAFRSIKDISDQKEHIEAQLIDLVQDDEKGVKLLERQHELQETLLSSGYYDKERSIERVLRGLGFLKKDFLRDTSWFSGGWQMRIALAKVLLETPDILLLDEPTNFLDIEARNWLETFLSEFKGGIILVSHDRYFLDVTVNEVIELFNGKLKRYKGNYTYYEKIRNQELKTLLTAYKKQQDEIKKTEEFISRFRYNSSKSALVQSRIKQLEKIDLIKIPENMKKIHFSFPPPPHSGKNILQLDNINKSYNKNSVIDNLSLHMGKGEKILIAGKNGAGKSTLLRIISGRDKDFEGTVKYGTDVKTGYYAEEGDNLLDISKTVIEEIESEAPMNLIPKLRGLLGAFLFRGDDIYKSVSVLSGGEKSRLSLLKLLLFPVNFLILDEPTNHLDLNSKEILLTALKNYSGTLIFVSHDRYFMEELTTKVLELKETGFRIFPGNYSDYLWKVNGENKNQNNIKIDSEVKIASGNKLSREKNNKTKGLIKKYKREEQDILRQIELLEKKHEEHQISLSNPIVYSNGKKVKDLKSKMTINEKEQDNLHNKWIKIETLLSSLEQGE